ncbi:MAG: ABC transporter ATP-binding protein [Eubacteriaceae bacterium]
MTKTVLETKNITVSYGEKIILKRLNICIEEGEFVGIIGPNGTGKSTLIKAITDVIDINSGEIIVNNTNNKELSKRERAKLIAVVPQEFSIDFDFTAFDIVMMGRNPHSYEKKKTENNDFEIVKEAMILTNTWVFKDSYFNKLSGGERQRIIVARAIAQQSKIILLDEPTSHLDIHHQLEVMELIHMLKKKRNITVIAVLHDVNMAARFSDRLVLLNDGNVVAEGTPQEVIKEEYLSELYHMEMIVRDNKILGKKEIIPLRVIKNESIQKNLRIHVICGGGTGEEIIEKLNSLGFIVTAGVINEGDSDWELCKILNIKCVDALPFSGISEEESKDNLQFINNADCVLISNVPFGTGNLKNLQVLLNINKDIYMLKNRTEIDYCEGMAHNIIKKLEDKENFIYINNYDEFISKIDDGV